ncbi:MAG TPA: hypothetical protein PK398_00425 [Candidatus Gracilibacteria bacterium]|nr:hypothetical protein [Candidatus Gracilibacteria bacterium]
MEKQETGNQGDQANQYENIELYIHPTYGGMVPAPKFVRDAVIQALKTGTMKPRTDTNSIVEPGQILQKRSDGRGFEVISPEQFGQTRESILEVIGDSIGIHWENMN